MKYTELIDLLTKYDFEQLGVDLRTCNVIGMISHKLLTPDCQTMWDDMCKNHNGTGYHSIDGMLRKDASKPGFLIITPNMTISFVSSTGTIVSHDHFQWMCENIFRQRETPLDVYPVLRNVFSVPKMAYIKSVMSLISTDLIDDFIKCIHCDEGGFYRFGANNAVVRVTIQYNGILFYNSKLIFNKKGNLQTICIGLDHHTVAVPVNRSHRIYDYDYAFSVVTGIEDDMIRENRSKLEYYQYSTLDNLLNDPNIEIKPSSTPILMGSKQFNVHKSILEMFN